MGAQSFPNSRRKIDEDKKEMKKTRIKKRKTKICFCRACKICSSYLYHKPHQLPYNILQLQLFFQPNPLTPLADFNGNYFLVKSWAL